MYTYSLPLFFTPLGDRAYLRELCGQDLLALGGTDSAAAIRLLDAVLQPGVDTEVGPGRAAAIATADRDQLLAAIYRGAYGDKVESTLDCAACAEPMDLSFSLGQLLAHLRDDDDEPIAVAPGSAGTFQLPEGCRFRLPNGEDEQCIRGLDSLAARQLLLERCVVEGAAEENATAVQAAMARIAPVCELTLDLDCPECGHTQQSHFDLQFYLLNALLLEKEQLPVEVHRLTVAYGWSHSEIMRLPRSLRRQYLSLIVAESGYA